MKSPTFARDRISKIRVHDKKESISKNQEIASKLSTGFPQLLKVNMNLNLFDEGIEEYEPRLNYEKTKCLFVPDF